MLFKLNMVPIQANHDLLYKLTDDRSAALDHHPDKN